MYRVTEQDGREGAAHFVVELPSEVRWIEPVVDYVLGRAEAFAYAGPRLTLNLRVGIIEALANAIICGNAEDPRKRVRLEVTIDAQRVELEVSDEGPGFSPDQLPDPTAPENLGRPCGRGVYLLRRLMDEVRYNERGNAVRMVLYREAALPVR